jgi:Holliday junction resolvase RusA-like endonuclease
VHQAAADAVTADLEMPWNGPVAVYVTFRFAMPASRLRAIRERGWAWKTSKPDLDKLLRSTCDSLVTAGLLTDDSRIVRAVAEKVEIDGSWTGAEIMVTTDVGQWS